jgi:hypothetical protein
VEITVPADKYESVLLDYDSEGHLVDIEVVGL